MANGYSLLAGCYRHNQRNPAATATINALISGLESTGVRIAFCRDWTMLHAVNAQNLADWYPLMPKPRTAPGFWIAALDRNDRVVATQGIYQLDCRHRSFGERLGDLTAFHDDPLDNERLACSSLRAYSTRGLVAFTVAGWVAPAWRGRWLFFRMAFLARLLAWEEWPVRWWCGLVDPENVALWQTPRAGQCQLDRHPTVYYHQNSVGELPLHVLRFSRADMLADIARRSNMPTTQYPPSPARLRILKP